MPASELDGWIIDNSRVNHPETIPPTIEIQVNHSVIVQTGIPITFQKLLKSDNLGGEDSEIGNGAEAGGCFINSLL